MLGIAPATSEKEIPLRHNTSTKIFTTRDCVWPLEKLDPDRFERKQFSKMLDDFACAWLHRIQAFLDYASKTGI